jgi:hypothetical protein
VLPPPRSSSPTVHDPWAALVDLDALRLVSAACFVVVLLAFGRFLACSGATQVQLPVTPCGAAVEVEGVLHCDDDVLPFVTPVAIGRRVDAAGEVVHGDGWLSARAFEVLGLPVDVNSADVERLSSLPGIGPSRALDIVAARPIREIQALDAISGIGPATFTRLKHRARVGPVVRAPSATTDVSPRGRR